MKLTIEQLKQMKPGEVFARGQMEDSPLGLNMSGSGNMLKWLAVRGEGYWDWAIYCYWAYAEDDYVRTNGDKVCREDHIKRLVPCDDEAYKLYRF